MLCLVVPTVHFLSLISINQRAVDACGASSGHFHSTAAMAGLSLSLVAASAPLLLLLLQIAAASTRPNAADERNTMRVPDQVPPLTASSASRDDLPPAVCVHACTAIVV